MKIYKILLFLFAISFLTCEEPEDDELTIIQQEACQNVETTVGAGMVMHLPIRNARVENIIDPEVFAVNNGGTFVQDRFGIPSEAIALKRDEQQYIEVVNPIGESLRTFTISFWVKNFHLSSVEGYIMSLRGASRFDIAVDSDKIEFRTRHRRDRFLSTQTVSSEIKNPSFIYGEWSHIVFRYKHRYRVDAFVNGEPSATTDLLDEWYEYSDKEGGSAFGCYNRNSSAPSNFWSGELDDVRIYERWLCIKEIEHLANR